MQELYRLSLAEIGEKQKLYIHSEREHASFPLSFEKGEKIDFTTYFNGFSIGKWERFTTLESVTLDLELEGTFEITYFRWGREGCSELGKERISGPHHSHCFSLGAAPQDIYGFALRSLSSPALLKGGAWKGDFAEWENRKLGVSITTFKREDYVKRNIQVIRSFQKQHPWLVLQVVDNGSTLQEMEQQDFRILHNRNYGGSGGFTRGMLEYVSRGDADDILLMDDDIVLDTTALERTHSMLCGLKKSCRNHFLAGAMLSMEEPTRQYENTACWKKIRLYGFGKGFDLTKPQTLAANEVRLDSRNRYGAWWYCVIPVKRIQEIGYPLPVFVKGDDMEYGIRNQQECITLNGIGVWHQSFQSKISPVVNYYSDRNMLIINNYALDCGFLTFCIAVCGRFVKRLFQFNLRSLLCLKEALADYNRGLSGITAMPADQKMREILQRVNGPCSWTVFFSSLTAVVKTILLYQRTSNEYKTFRKEKLMDARFWRQFLFLEG